MNQSESSEVDKSKEENVRCDVIKDIIATFKRGGAYENFKRLLDDLSYFNFSRSWVDSPAAFGDTYKHTVEYTIGDFQFKYCHTLPEGEISSAEWSITYKTKKDELFKYSYMKSMRERFFKSTKLPTETPSVYPLNAGIFDEFKTKYVLAKDDKLKLKYILVKGDELKYILVRDDTYYVFFSILNAFTNGHCMGIRVVDEKTTVVYQHLCDMIDIEKY